MTLDEAAALDAADPLAPCRTRFQLPPGLIYLDGNSLGALPSATAGHLADVVTRQWGGDLIGSWNKHGWIDAPVRIAAKIAPLIGARENEVILADSTSICLFKALSAAIAANPSRSTILVQADDFPTDHYVAQGLVHLLPRLRLRTVAPNCIAESVDEDTAVILLSQVDYRSSARHDMRPINQAAQRKGALTLWDLSHSAGAIAVDCGGDECDLAVGCGYKYLNGGPGAPAFVFAAERLHAQLHSPLPGWMGHDEPFSFLADFSPARGMSQFLTGTPSILALAALESGIDTFSGVSMGAIEVKSRRLSQLFVELVEEQCSGQDLRLVSPREPERRGSHVSFAHDEGFAIMQALIARQVVGDYRAPDVIRFGFAPLYNSFEDIVTAATILAEILQRREWDQPRFRERARVT
ncbi:MAG TPA: kynureninase [Sphingomicrobium sp.]|nr:kynureninase [Sphingomicrobium sp.]